MRRRSIHVTAKQRDEAARWRLHFRLLWAKIKEVLDARWEAARDDADKWRESQK